MIILYTFLNDIFLLFNTWLYTIVTEIIKNDVFYNKYFLILLGH